jgi:hypothetical protein
LVPEVVQLEIDKCWASFEEDTKDKLESFEAEAVKSLKDTLKKRWWSEIDDITKAVEPVTIPRPAPTSGAPEGYRTAGRTAPALPATFQLATAAWTVDNILLRNEKRNSGRPFPPGRCRKACWRGPARHRGLVIPIEQQLFSRALQSGLPGRSENQ